MRSNDEMPRPDAIVVPLTAIVSKPEPPGPPGLNRTAPVLSSIAGYLISAKSMPSPVGLS